MCYNLNNTKAMKRDFPFRRRPILLNITVKFLCKVTRNRKVKGKKSPPM